MTEAMDEACRRIAEALARQTDERVKALLCARLGVADFDWEILRGRLEMHIRPGADTRLLLLDGRPFAMLWPPQGKLVGTILTYEARVDPVEG